MYYNTTHTDHDLAGFARDGIDPDTREPRKQPVRCPWCPPTLRATIWNRSGACGLHSDMMREWRNEG